jgi:hypothetical protein
MSLPPKAMGRSPGLLETRDLSHLPLFFGKLKNGPLTCW